MLKKKENVSMILGFPFAVVFKWDCGRDWWGISGISHKHANERLLWDFVQLNVSIINVFDNGNVLSTMLEFISHFSVGVRDDSAISLNV